MKLIDKDGKCYISNNTNTNTIWSRYNVRKMNIDTKTEWNYHLS